VLPPKKKTGLFTWLVVAILGIGFISALVPSNQSATAAAPPAVKPPPTEQEKLAESDRIQTADVVLTIKRAAKDPDSFKLISAGSTKDGASCIEYSATNSFNARLKSFVVVIRGKTTISESVGDWNKFCANKPMTDYTDYFQKFVLPS
jgi:hypothetical protein